MFDASLLAPNELARISRERYERMLRHGVLDEDDRVELLHGLIVAMSPQHPPHAKAIQRLTEMLTPSLGRRAGIRVQLPFIAFDESEPEPDIAIVPAGDYGDAHPERAHLVIEVADESLRKDRHVKGPLYAASQVREYWIVNLLEKVVEVHRGPQDGAWNSITRQASTAVLAPEAFPDVLVALADLL